MSQWTHVAGIVRVDALEFLTSGIEIKIRDAFGNTVEFEDSNEKWEQCNVPLGSEGSVQYGIVRTGKYNSISWGLIYIWGDLRDYAVAVEIRDWLNKAIRKLNDNGIFVRQCSVNISIEGWKEYAIYMNNIMDDIMDDNEYTYQEVTMIKIRQDE